MYVHYRVATLGLAASLGFCAMNASGQRARLEKVSPHCHLLAGSSGLPNAVAVVTEEGILLVNPPSGEETAAFLDALKRISTRPIRWVVYTDLARELASADSISKQGALALVSAASHTARKSAAPDAVLPLRLVFERQLRLFPENLEIRIFSPEKKWHEGGDIVIHMPAEKVLLVGDLFSPGALPDFEGETAAASPLLWIDALKQVIDSIPLLKSAMPQPKADPAKPAEEPKSLEELIAVIPAVGRRSNLKEMKDLLATVQRLHAELSRAVSQQRPRESFLELPAFNAYRSLANVESFAGRMYDDLKRR